MSSGTGSSSTGSSSTGSSSTGPSGTGPSGAGPYRALDALGDARARSRGTGHGIVLGADAAGALRFARPQHGVLVLGPPRSGKTTAFVVPNVLAACGPVVVASTKRDAMDATAPARLPHGHCALFDPGGQVEPPPGVTAVGWSPLPSSATFDGAILVVEAMVGATRPEVRPADEHWVERATALLAPLFHAGALAGVRMREVVSWVDQRDATEALTVLSGADAVRACEVLRNITLTDDRERSGIWSSASGILAAYRSEAALRASEHHLLDAAAFLDPTRGAGTLYICATGQQQRYAAPLVAGLLEDVRAAAYARPAGIAPVLAVLDELANIAPLRDLPKILSEGGSQGLVVLACLQDLAQARGRWGTEAEGFLSLFGSKMLMPGIGDMRTLEAASALAGDHDVPTRSTTGSSRLLRAVGLGRKASTTWSTRRERRLPVDAVARGRPGEALCLGPEGEVGFVRLTPHHEHPLYRAACGLGRAGRGGPARDRPAEPVRAGAGVRRRLGRSLDSPSR